MASIRYRNGKWQVRVNRKGFISESQTFLTKQDAERWGRSVESEMDKGSFISRAPAENTTLNELISLYIKEVSPTHKGYEPEVIKLKAVKLHPNLTHQMHRILTHP